MLLCVTGQRRSRMPAVVLLAHGSRDPRSPATIREIAGQVRTARPGLRAEAAFLDLSEPSFDAIVSELATAGHRDIVVVPLLLTDAYHARTDVPAVIAAAMLAHDGLTIRPARTLGLADEFLDVLDRRLDEALRAVNAAPPDALVLAAAGSSIPEANRAVAEFTRRWGSRRGLPAIPAHAAGTAQTTAEAVQRLRAEGHLVIAVGSLFLAPGLLPERAERLAHVAGAVAVAAPMGSSPELVGAVLARYDHATG